MDLNKSQWSVRADGMPEPMTPSMFGPPTPKPTKTPTTKPTPKKTTRSGGMSIPKENNYNPVGSGASAWTGGSAGGGGGAMGRK
jgi:hypothetical protein